MTKIEWDPIETIIRVTGIISLIYLLKTINQTSTIGTIFPTWIQPIIGIIIMGYLIKWIFIDDMKVHIIINMFFVAPIQQIIKIKNNKKIKRKKEIEKMEDAIIMLIFGTLFAIAGIVAYFTT